MMAWASALLSTLLLTAPALAGSSASSCFLPPADPTDCSRVAVAANHVEAARAHIAEKFRSSEGSYNTNGLTCYLAAANYVSRCEQRLCSTLEFPVQKSLENGWQEESRASFSGQNGACIFSRERSSQLVKILAPNGKDVMSRAISSKGGAKAVFQPSESWNCSAGGGRKTERRLTLSEMGVLAIDSTGTSVAANHWGRRAEVTPRGLLHLSTPNASTLRLEWPNGAFLEFGDDALPKASNFIDEAMWSATACRTKSDGLHFFPAVETKPGQHLGRIAPGFVKS